MKAVNPSTECRKLAEALREIANGLPVGELKAEYEYLVRGFLRLAAQFEHDRETKTHCERRSIEPEPPT
jgi:hypothetical protein